MKVKLKRHLKSDKSVIEKFHFLDNLQDGLRNYSVVNNLESCLKVVQTNYKHHSEIHDIKIIENGEEKSMLKLFDNFSLIIIPEDRKIKILLTSKDKTNDSYYKITGHLNEFQKMLNEKVNFMQGEFDEIIFFD